MKVAWIGVLGAAIGALISVFGSEWIRSPSEGIFFAEYNSITKYDVDPHLRDQVTKYPITVKVSHIDGPAVDNITLTLSSDTPIENFNSIKEDDASKNIVQDGKIIINIPLLRKGSSLEYRALSVGSPSITMDVTHENGRIVSDKKTNSNEWYRSEIAIVLYVVVGVIIIFGVILLFLKNKYYEYGNIQYIDFVIVMVILVSDLFPLAVSFSNAIVVFLILILLRRSKDQAQ